MRQAILGALCAVFLFTSLAYRAGDFTCVHPSQIRSFYFPGTGASYTTSATKNFLITDVVGVQSAGPSLTILVNGTIVLTIPHEQVMTGQSGRFASLHFSAGIVCPPGSVITAGGATAPVCISGFEY